MNKSYENCKPDKSIMMSQSNQPFFDEIRKELLKRFHRSDQQSIRTAPGDESRRGPPESAKANQASGEAKTESVEVKPWGFPDTVPENQQVLHVRMPDNVKPRRPTDPGVYVLAKDDYEGLRYVRVGEVGGRLSQISRLLRRQVKLKETALTIDDVMFDENAIAAMKKLDNRYVSDDLAQSQTHTYTGYEHDLEDYKAPLGLKKVNRRYRIDDMVQMSTRPRIGEIDRSDIDTIVDDQGCIKATEAMRYLSVGNAQDFPCAFWEKAWLQQAYKRQIWSVTPLFRGGEYPKPIAYHTDTSSIHDVIEGLFEQVRGLDVLQFDDGEWVITVKAPLDFKPSRDGMEVVFHKQYDPRDPDLADFFRQISRRRPANGRSTMKYRDASISIPGDEVNINLVIDLIPRESILEVQACADLPDEYLVLSVSKKDRGFKVVDYRASSINSRHCYLDPSVLSYDYLMRVYEYKKRTPGARFFMPAQRLLKLPEGGYDEVAKIIGSLFYLPNNRLYLDETLVTDLVSVFRKDLIDSLSAENTSPEGREKVADFYTGILSLMYLTFHGVMPNPAVVFQGSSYIFREMMDGEFPYLYSYTRDVHYRLFGDTLLKLAFRYTRGPNSKFRPVFPAEIVLSRVYTIMGPFAGLDVYTYNDERKQLDSDHLLEKLPSYVNTMNKHSLFFSGMDPKWRRRIWNILDFPEPASIQSVEEMAKLDEVFNRYVDIDDTEAKYLNATHRFKRDGDIKLNRIKQPTAPLQGMNAQDLWSEGREEYQREFDYRKIGSGNLVREYYAVDRNGRLYLIEEPIRMKSGQEVYTYTGGSWTR